jgi:hypothetical protein
MRVRKQVPSYAAILRQDETRFIERLEWVTTSGSQDQIASMLAQHERDKDVPLPVLHRLLEAAIKAEERGEF